MGLVPCAPSYCHSAYGCIPIIGPGKFYLKNAAGKVICIGSTKEKVKDEIAKFLLISRILNVCTTLSFLCIAKVSVFPTRFTHIFGALVFSNIFASVTVSRKKVHKVKSFLIYVYKPN